MKRQYFGHGILVFAVLTLNGCDSAQYGASNTSEPKAESTLMTAAEMPTPEKPSLIEGTLRITEETAGAEENAEGINHYQQGHWDVAQEHFNKALATNSDLPEAHYNLALALDKLGNHGEATNHFSMALKLAPEDPRIKDSGILKSHVGG